MIDIDYLEKIAYRGHLGKAIPGAILNAGLYEYGNIARTQGLASTVQHPIIAAQTVLNVGRGVIDGTKSLLRGNGIKSSFKNALSGIKRRQIGFISNSAGLEQSGAAGLKAIFDKTTYDRVNHSRLLKKIKNKKINGIDISDSNPLSAYTFNESKFRDNTINNLFSEQTTTNEVKEYVKNLEKKQLEKGIVSYAEQTGEHLDKIYDKLSMLPDSFKYS